MLKKCIICRLCEPKWRMMEIFKCGQTDEEDSSSITHFLPHEVMYSMQNYYVYYIVYKKRLWKKLLNWGGLIQEVIFLNVNVYILFLPYTAVNSSSFKSHPQHTHWPQPNASDTLTDTSGKTSNAWLNLANIFLYVLLCIIFDLVSGCCFSNSLQQTVKHNLILE